MYAQKLTTKEEKLILKTLKVVVLVIVPIKDDGKWEAKVNDDKCTRGKLYEPKDGKDGTPIKILKSGEGHDDIRQKIEDFCAKTNGDTTNSVASGDKNGGSSSQDLYQEWKCYEGKDVQKVGQDDDDDDDDDDVEHSGGLCILQKNHEGVQKQKTYNDFFNFWVAHMLKDSIHWKKKLQRCLKNGTTIKCKDGCKNPCKCFERWVKQKGNEWTQIKDHFLKQDDIKKETEMDPIVTLELVLELEFSDEYSTQDTENSLDAQELKHLKEIKELLEKEKKKNQEAAGANGKKTIMDKLIEHEEKEATKCKN
ncbi:hypothetical protein PFTANZ_06611, partial [Plasmodium falciparum Tanzania (2000708)]